MVMAIPKPVFHPRVQAIQDAVLKQAKNAHPELKPLYRQLYEDIGRWHAQYAYEPGRATETQFVAAVNGCLGELARQQKRTEEDEVRQRTETAIARMGIRRRA